MSNWNPTNYSIMSCIHFVYTEEESSIFWLPIRVNSNAIEAIEAIEAIHLQLTTLSKLSTTNEAMPLHRYRRYRR